MEPGGGHLTGAQEGPASERSDLRWYFLVLILFGCMLLAAPIVDWEASRWEKSAIELNPQFSLIVSRRHTHPFLAEYERRLRVLHSGEPLRDLDYPHDTGGGFPIWVRYYADETRMYVRMTDRLSDRVVDLQTGRYVPVHLPPEGKEGTSFVLESELPRLRRCFELDTLMQVRELNCSTTGVLMGTAG